MFDSTTSRPGLLLLMVVMSCLTRPGVAGYLLSVGAGAPRLVLIPLAAQMTLRGSSLFFCGLSILYHFFVFSLERLQMVFPSFVLQILFVLFLFVLT